MKQKFKAGDYVAFKQTMFNPSVYWVIVEPKPDANGQIVLSNPRHNEYALAFQSDLRRI